MRINFSDIDRDSFNVFERQLDGIGTVYLIGPKKSKHVWRAEELNLRSILCDSHGQVLCSGHKKFKNLGEDPESDLLMEKAVRQGKAWYTMKMDGSLIIRSVINGQVNFRTRGSHTLGEGFMEPVMKLVREKYPNLLNPLRDTRYSILMEYTSPENQIVVSYSEPCLTVLGLMDLTAELPEFVSSPEVLRELELDYGTPGVQFFEFGDLNSARQEIAGWKEAEGVVVWSQLEDGNLLLTKIKADEYRRLHSLKFQLSDEKVRWLAWVRDLWTVEDLQNAFFELGVDWEAVKNVEPVFLAFVERRLEYWKMIEKLSVQIQYQVDVLETRKEKALKLKELTKDCPELFGFGIDFAMNLSNHSSADYADALALDVSIKNFARLRAMAEMEVSDLGSNNVVVEED